MIPVTGFSGKTVALFGLGGSGLATARALIAGGAEVLAWDDAAKRVDEARAAGVSVCDLHDISWGRIAALILSPGVPLTHPVPHWTVELAKAHDVEIIGDVELFCRERARACPDAPFIAITGTNGKSTTTALIAHLLKELGFNAQMGGNIGTPILELEPPRSDRYYVVECSSYQIDLTPSLNPTVGIHMNLSPDHIDRHGSMENYAAIKERLVTASSVAVVGVDDALSLAIAERLEAAGHDVRRISGHTPETRGVYTSGPVVHEVMDGQDRVVASLDGIDSLRGEHNWQNAAAAFAALRALDLPANKIAEALRTFPGLDHRMQLVARAGKVLFVNDSKATNADAAEKALKTYDRIYWIAGGRQKAGGITSLESYFPKIAKAYLIGECADAFADTLKGKVVVEMCGTLDVAVHKAAADAQHDGAEEVTVLLSPACASFDQFPGFEVRGHAFADLVNELDLVRDTNEVA